MIGKALDWWYLFVGQLEYSLESKFISPLDGWKEDFMLRIITMSMHEADTSKNFPIMDLKCIKISNWFSFLCSYEGKLTSFPLLITRWTNVIFWSNLIDVCYGVYLYLLFWSLEVMGFLLSASSELICPDLFILLMRSSSGIRQYYSTGIL